VIVGNVIGRPERSKKNDLTDSGIATVSIVLAAIVFSDEVVVIPRLRRLETSIAGVVSAV
jgi:hypothetical protein